MSLELSAMLRTVALALALMTAIAVRAVGAQTGGTGSNLRVIEGVVKTFSDASFALDVRGAEMVFAIPPQTRLVAKGPRPRDLVLRDPKHEAARWFTKRVTDRDRVRVTFRPSDGVLNAVEIRVIQR